MIFRRLERHTTRKVDGAEAPNQRWWGKGTAGAAATLRYDMENGLFSCSFGRTKQFPPP